MTTTRRLMLGLATGAAVASFTVLPAFAQDWKAKYPELVYATVPAENASGVTERMGPFMEYLSKELGVKVTLRIAADYAAVIEGQRAGSIHIGDYGPGVVWGGDAYLVWHAVTRHDRHPAVAPARHRPSGRGASRQGLWCCHVSNHLPLGFTGPNCRSVD